MIEKDWVVMREGFATKDGIKELVVAAIEKDWAALCVSPQSVAERVAEVIYPLVADSPVEEEIKGAPWASR